MTGLPTLPVPAFAAAVLAALAVAAARRAEGASPWLVGLIALCAGQALLVALVQHWGVAALRPLQPVGAAAIPPVAWLAFAATTGAAAVAPARHAAGPVAAALLVPTVPAGLDVAVPLLFLGYGGALLARLRGADPVPRLPLGGGARPARLWGLIALALIGSGLSDVAISGAVALGRPEARPWIVTLGSTATLALVGWLAVAPELRPDARVPAAAAPAGSEADAALVLRLERFLGETGLHLDPDLSLARLARRLGVPEKRLSAAVNRATGDNVSRFVNARRVAAACARLEAGASVTEAWLASGFSARSNFNREFRRVTGVAPRDWRAAV
ncbi:helix-turn-helix transcriptional regulator [Jannaschia sp. Os4]|uniref:helix-turn-helix domain-containing protein n=1 Tax=Jannaschia sp. Os4 TaxID=2807617 RepID=UPI0019399D9F|nr:AraC family transcriptional regulator [Jannaschia sp. Os4]MBM2575277.1 helix-turn-helix transcriptional regulator [Jannaschia sp. Os4]